MNATGASILAAGILGAALIIGLSGRPSAQAAKEGQFPGAAPGPAPTGRFQLFSAHSYRQDGTNSLRPADTVIYLLDTETGRVAHTSSTRTYNGNQEWVVNNTSISLPQEQPGKPGK
jgi:hypothetical protein